MKALLWIAILAAVGLAFSSCGTTYPRRDPRGQPFPRVVGNALDGVEVALPDAGKGEPMLLLVGYQQNTQFDLDRWLLALSQSEWKTRTFEVPTLPGLMPGMFSGFIDGGMRRGIPQEDWGGVVTLYGDAKKVAEFTGNDDGLPGRVLLLDGEGRVAFFHDRGFSVGALQQLQAARAQLGK
jgi:hypothetical protein